MSNVIKLERSEDEMLPRLLARFRALRPVARKPTDIPGIDDPLCYDFKEVRFDDFRVFYQAPPLKVTGNPVLHVMVCDLTGNHDDTDGYVFDASIDPADDYVFEVRIWKRGDWETRVFGERLETAP